MNARALVFDLDDTLYPESAFVASGMQAVDRWLHENFGVFGFRRCAWELFQAGKRGLIFNEVLRFLDVPDDETMVKDMVAIYRAHAPSITLFDDARWALDHFSTTHTLGLITDGYSKTQRNKVQALGISGRFRAAVFTDDLGRENWKPSALPFRTLQEALQLEGKSCVYVADNPAKDFLAPALLGWTTVHVKRPGGEYSKVAGYAEGRSPDVCVSSLFELKELFP